MVQCHRNGAEQGTPTGLWSQGLTGGVVVGLETSLREVSMLQNAHFRREFADDTRTGQFIFVSVSRVTGAGSRSDLCARCL